MNRQIHTWFRTSVAAVVACAAVLALPAAAPVDAAPTATGTIVVKLFHDFNANGRRSVTGDIVNPAIDVTIAGAAVTAVCLTDTGPDGLPGTGDGETYGAPVTATADGAGNYTIAANGTPCRVEVNNLPAHYTAAPIGFANRGLTSFADVGSTIDVGIHVAGEFCQNDPQLATVCFVSGGATTEIKNARGVETLVPPQAIGSPTALYPSTPIANTATVGSIYGLAWEPTSRRLFGAAYLKRKAEAGPNGLGAVYVLNPNGPATSASLLVDLATLFPAAIGTDPRAGVAKPAGYWDNDEVVIASIGKVGLGDIEVSADGSTLYVVALGDRKLYAIPLTGPITTATVASYQIPVSMPSCGGAPIRPFGIGLDPRSGTIRVGGVCPSAAPRAYVWSLDAGTFNAVLDQPIVRSDPDPVTAWLAWNDGDLSTIAAWNPQPMLTDIAFRGDDMVLGIRDRYGDMAPGNGLAPSDAPYPRGGGDVLRACPNGAGMYSLEHPTSPYCGTVGEFFFQDEAGDAADESGAGALAQIGGWRGVYDTSYGAVAFTPEGTPIEDNWYRGGLQYHAHDTRTQIGSGDIYFGEKLLFGKTNGMGDLVAMCDRAPIEIGNRVWFDTNKNGVQDPGERPAPNIPVTLNIGGITYRDITNTLGEYVFSSDTRAIGVRAYIDNGQYGVRELVKGASVTLSVPTTRLIDGISWNLTGQNVGDDRRDSDGNPATGSTPPIIVGSPGFNDHDWDFGFARSYDLALTKTVTSTGTYGVGSTVTFDLVASNVGSDASATGYTVTDLLPAGLTFDGVATPATGPGFACATPAGQSVTCTATSALAGGATASPIRITAKVSATAPFGSAMRNVAWVTPSITDGAETNPLGTPPTSATDTVATPTNNDAEGSITIPPPIDLAIAKTLTTTGALSPGATVVFDLAITNHGSAASLAGFTVSDTLPAGLTFTGVATPAAGAGYNCAAPAGQTVTCTSNHTLSALAGATPTDHITVTAKVVDAPTFNTPLRNVAWVSPAPGEIAEINPLGTPPTTATDTATTATNNDSHALVTVPSLIDLALTKTLTTNTVLHPGATVVFDLAITNNGPGTAKAGFTVSDTLPTGLAFTAVTTPATGVGYTCTAPAGQTVTCISDHALAPNSGGVPIDHITVEAKVIDAPTFNAPLRNIAWVTPAADDVVESNPLGSAPTSTTNTASTPTNNDSEATVTIPAPIDLTLSKSVTTAGPYVAGSTVQFDLTVSNNGPGTALAGFTVGDLLPAGLTFTGVAAPASGVGYNCSATGQIVRCTSGHSLAPVSDGGPVDHLVVTAKVSAAPLYNTTLKNVAWIAPAPTDVPESNPLGTVPTSATETALTPTNNDSEASISMPAPINLRLVKHTTTPAPYSPGMTVLFDLAVSNTGPGVAKAGFTVTDRLPAGLTFVGVSVPAAGTGYVCDPVVGRLVSCTSDHPLAPVSSGGPMDHITITAKIDLHPPIGTSMRNLAWVRPSDEEEVPEGNPLDEPPTPDTDTDSTGTDNDSQSDVRIPIDYDLALVKTMPVGQRAMLWGTLTYTVTVANQGNVPSGAFTITDRLPAGTTFVSASAGGTHAAGVVTWSVPAASQLAPGAARSFSLTVRITGDFAKYRNWAEISTDSGVDLDSTPDTNTGRDATAPNDRAVNHNDITKDVVTGDEDDNDYEEILSSTRYDLALVKRAAAGQTVAVGSTVTFTVTVKNQGNVASGPITVQDHLPAGATFVGTDNGGTQSGGVVTWRVADLAVGATKTFTVRMTIAAEGLRYINWAEITVDSGSDEDSTPDADTGQDGSEPNDAVVNHNDITRDVVTGDEDDNDFEQLNPTVVIPVPETA